MFAMFDEVLSVNNAHVRSLMAWWADAGVDQMIDEVPTAWLDRGAKKVEPERKMALPPEILPPKPEMPRDLAGFITWLLTLSALDPICPVARRIVTSGDPASDLMILIDVPEPADHEAGYLLSGDAGNLFDRMLAAVGRDRNSVYIAAVCPGRPPAGLVSDELLIDLAPLARQHIALAAPKRLWLMGQAASRAALGVDDAGIRGRLGNFNHEGVNVTAVASFSPRFLLANPKRKAAAWADMQMLTKGIDA
jgi:uracil-DNA glycosylase